MKIAIEVELDDKLVETVLAKEGYHIDQFRIHVQLFGNEILQTFFKDYWGKDNDVENTGR